MSKLEVDAIEPQSGTTLTIGASGDTVTIPSGATLSGTSLALAGNIGIGGATPTTSGTGITFPGTQSASTDANTLDDYEEGTWSPEIRPTSGGGYSWGPQAGRYIKVGSLVTLHGTVGFSAVGSVGTGQLYLQNLPFANLNTGDESSRSALCIGRANGFTTNNPSTGAFATSGGSTQIELSYRSSANGGTLDLPAASMATNAIITFSISYTAA